MTKPMGMSLWDCLDSLMHMGGINLLWVAPVSSERLLACLSGKVNPSTSKQASKQADYYVCIHFSLLLIVYVV